MMTTISIVRCYSGFQNRTDELYVGTTPPDYASYSDWDVAEYELPAGYQLDADGKIVDAEGYTTLLTCGATRLPADKGPPVLHCFAKDRAHLLRRVS